MDLSFADMCDMFTPKMNPEIMNGYVCHEMKDTEKRVDEILRKAFDGLFDGALKYHGFEPCTPQEVFEHTTRPKNTRRTFELALSDIYLVKIMMSFKDQPLPEAYLYLPYVLPGGLIHIGGPLYHLTPVLSDKVISPEARHIFVRLYQYKMNFYQETHSVVVNGFPEHVQVAWSNIYKQKSGKKKLPTSHAHSTLVHYLLARMGFTQMFLTYAGVVPVVGTEKTINDKLYDSSAWVIIKTAYSKTRPSTSMDSVYKATDIRLAIPKDKWTAATKALVYGFFYVVDHFPKNCVAEAVDHPDTWKLTLGYILFSSAYTAGRILSLVDEHFLSSDTYMDDISIQKLKEKGYVVNNFSDLLGLITTKYKELCEEGNQSNTTYGKYLDTLRDVLYPITSSIFTTKYSLMKLAVKGMPQYGSVKDIFVRRFKPGPIFKLTSKSIVAEAVSYSGDHKYFKITSRLSQQESSPGIRSSNARKVLNENHYLNTSMFMVGSILFLSKKKPVPLSHANPFMLLDLQTGTVLENPKYKEILALADEQLSKKS